MDKYQRKLLNRAIFSFIILYGSVIFNRIINEITRGYYNRWLTMEGIFIILISESISFYVFFTTIFLWKDLPDFRIKIITLLLSFLVLLPIIYIFSMIIIYLR